MGKKERSDMETEGGSWPCAECRASWGHSGNPKHQRPPAKHMTSSHLTPFTIFDGIFSSCFTNISFLAFEAEPRMMLTTEEQPRIRLPRLPRGLWIINIVMTSSVITMFIGHARAPALTFPARLGYNLFLNFKLNF